MLAFKNQKPNVPCSIQSNEGAVQGQWRREPPAEIQVCALWLICRRWQDPTKKTLAPAPELLSLKICAIILN